MLVWNEAEETWEKKLKKSTRNKEKNYKGTRTRREKEKEKKRERTRVTKQTARVQGCEQQRTQDEEREKLVP